MNAIIRLSLRYRFLVVVLSLVTLAYGGYLATQMPIDVFPDLDRPRVVLMTEAHGMAAEEVEALVSFPLESALLGATGVQDVRSQSGMGLSVVFVEFDWSTDIRVARQVVQERLTTGASELPADVKPQMAPIGSIMGQILIAGMHYQKGPNDGELAPLGGRDLPGGDKSLLVECVGKPGDSEARFSVWEPVKRADPTTWLPVRVTEWSWLPPTGSSEHGRARLSVMRVTPEGKEQVLSGEAVFLTHEQRQLNLRTMADWLIRPRLLKTSGIAQVITMGGGRKQFQVLVDPAALQEYGVTLQQVEEALKDNNQNTSGGYAVRGGAEQSIRVLGRLGSTSKEVMQNLQKVPVKTTKHRTILLKEIARVVEGPQVKRGDAGINGLPGVALTITKQPHTDTRDLTERLNAALREAEAGLSADIVLNPDLFQLRTFIDRAVDNVGEALIIGAGLVLIILFLFLLNFRTTFISLTAIPLSLVVTTVVFKLIGKLTGTELSINVMTLGGIAVAMGELVDDAIVDVENIFRRLRENSAALKPKPALRVIYDASVEIRSAIVFGTIMVILVFLPLFALSGIEGRLFTPLGVAYIVSILASLVVSLVVTPVLAYYLLARSRATHAHGDGVVVKALKAAATPLIRLSMAIPGPLLLLTWLCVGLAFWKLSTMGGDFLPKFNEGTAQVNVTLPSGASVEASIEATALVDAKLRENLKGPANRKGVILNFVRRTGRAELDEHAEPPNTSEYVVAIDPKAPSGRDAVIEKLRREIKEEVPGVDVEVEQPLAHLISHMLSGVTAQIAIKIYGDDLDTLERIANEIKAVITPIDGVSPPVVEPMRKVEELHIRLKRDELAYYGVSVAYVGEFVETALQGKVVSQVQEGQRRFDLVVRLEEYSRTDYPNLARLRVDLPDGKRQVYLGDLADIGIGSGANQVKRDNIRRRIVVRCNAEDRDLISVVNDIRTKVREKVPMPEGYFVEYGGQFESEERATTLIVVLAVVSMVGMGLVLFVLFPSVRIVLQVLNAIPAAFIGGVAALALTGQTLNVAAQVGFISLGGIAARNGILLVTHYIHLMRHEGEGFTKQMVLRGSLERLSPVLMTALTAGIALVPLVIAGHEPGREILYPVATVILGGLVTSTFCEFLIRPGLFWHFSGGDAERLAAKGADDDGLDTPTHRENELALVAPASKEHQV